MKSFKEFINSPKEFIAFSNAGGKLGEYDGFDHTKPYMYGQGGGPKDIGENLNPRNDPVAINDKSATFSDPEKSNIGLGEARNKPKNINIPDHHGFGYTVPRYNDEQAKNARLLSIGTRSNDDYHNIMASYTAGSSNLNGTLIDHHRLGTNPPRHILSNSFETEGLDTHALDRMIDSHRLPHAMTVYSGLHFNPNEHKGKIAHVPCYMSTSLSPHVAKDFGKIYDVGHSDGGRYKSTRVQHILRLHLPEGHRHLFTDNGSTLPGQGELILPRGMRYQIGNRPSHIITGTFSSHFGIGKNPKTQYHIWNARILPTK